jgi:hypothetical protein
MDLSLVTAMLGAQAGMTQLAVANSMLKMDADNDAAQQNLNSLANVAPGIGTNLNISA